MQQRRLPQGLPGDPQRQWLHLGDWLPISHLSERRPQGWTTARLSASPSTSEPTPCPPTHIGQQPPVWVSSPPSPTSTDNGPHQGSPCTPSPSQGLEHLALPPPRALAAPSLQVPTAARAQRKSTRSLRCSQPRRPAPPPRPAPHLPIPPTPAPVHTPLLPGTLLPHMHHSHRPCLPGFLFNISFPKRLPSTQLFPVYSPGVQGPDPSEQGSAALLPGSPSAQQNPHTGAAPTCCRGAAETALAVVRSKPHSDCTAMHSRLRGGGRGLGGTARPREPTMGQMQLIKKAPCLRSGSIRGRWNMGVTVAHRWKRTDGGPPFRQTPSALSRKDHRQWLPPEEQTVWLQGSQSSPRAEEGTRADGLGVFMG